MMSRQALLTLFCIVLALAAAAYITRSITHKSEVKNSAAALTLGTDESVEYTSLTGESVKLSDLEGTVRVVNSWASWSPLSRAELNELERLAAAYADRQVNVIAINRNEDRVRAERFLDQLGTFEHLQFLLDGDDAFYDRMDGKAMPETLFFDAAGNIVMHARGELSYDEMVTYVEAALSAE